MAITDLDEQLLVRAHQAGDEHAFGQIVRSQHRALYAHAYRRLGNHEAAEDAVQDTLLRAYRALPSFDGDLRLRAWLHRILTNVCHDESNRRKRAAGLIDRLEAQPLELAPDPVEEAVLHDTVKIMSGALAELPESYREALVLRYVDGLSFREVAEVTGVTEENARARVHRGRIALHKVLSRLSLMVAFLVPGVRRTQKALDAGGDSVATQGASEHTVSLTTQLASHMYHAAPVLNRVAVEGSQIVAAKSSVMATAVAAVAAVAAPVAAYSVYDSTNEKVPSPPAAVAAPADEFEEEALIAPSVATPVARPDASTSTSSSSSSTTVPVATSTTLPPSALAPFVGGDDAADDDADPDDATPPTTTSPSTTTPPEGESTPDDAVRGTIGGDAFAVTGVRPDFDVSGRSVMQGVGDPVSGVLEGRVYVSDTVGGDASAELTLTLDDGRSLRLRFQGTLDDDRREDGVAEWVLSGRYSLEGGEDTGIPEAGTASVVFRYVDAAPSSIAFDLQGESTPS